MTRTVVSELATQLNSQAIKYAMFVELLFDTGALRLHQAVGTLVASEPSGTPRPWIGVGNLGGISPVREQNDLQSHELELTLSGLDSTIIDLAENQNVSNRLAKMFVGAFDANDQLTGDLSFLWRGRMDRMRINYGEESNSVTVVCEGEASSLTRSRYAYLTNDMQQRRFSGDLGLEYVIQLPFQNTVWAGKSVTTRNTFSPTSSPSGLPRLGR